MATKFYGYTTTTPNVPPVASLAYTEITALLGGILQLDGRRSFDPDGGELTFKWSFRQVPIGSGLTDLSFKKLRSDYSVVAFTPDKTGVYIVQLTVNDGELDSTPVTSTVDVQLSRVPCGEGLVPDPKFLWSFLSDFWNLVEDREYITSIWSGVIQAMGADMITLWSNDYNKSLATIQNTVQRRWQRIDMVTELLDERQAIILVNKRSGKSDGNNGASGRIGEEPVDQTTSVFSAPYGDIEVGYADFERLYTNYGDKGRVIAVNGKGYTVSRTLRATDPTTSEVRSVVVIDQQTMPNGMVGVEWRVPHMLHVPSVDLEAAGVRKGDILVLEVKRKDIGLTAELCVQVVAVDRTRLGFEFTLDTLQTGGRSTDRELFRQLVQDLRILPYTATDNDITAAAKTFMSFLPVGINVASSPFSTYLITLTAKKVIHNSVSIQPSDVVSIPVIQEKIYKPPVVMLENLDYSVDHGVVSFVDGLFSLTSPAPEFMWAECVFVDNGPIIEANFGTMVDLARTDLTSKNTQTAYLSAVKGLFYAYTTGPNVSNIRLGLQILLGLPFAEERGRILEVENSYSVDAKGVETGRLLVEDITENGQGIGFRRLYFYPTVVGLEGNPITGEIYKVGDILEKWAPVCKGVEVQDYVSDPNWWRRSLSGIEILKFFTFKATVNSDVFDLNDMLFAFDFLKKIKPAYTRVLSLAFKIFYEDIEIEDILSFSNNRILLYDNVGGGLEATARADDDNRRGSRLWHLGSRPFATRVPRVLRDVTTTIDGSTVVVTSPTGWDPLLVRGRQGTGSVYLTPSSPVREGDILVIFRGQPGAGATFDRFYEIDEVLDANTLGLLQEVELQDPVTAAVTPIDTAMFSTGAGLSVSILRRMCNPLTMGADLTVAVSHTNLVESLGSRFISDGVGPECHLIIESGVNKGEYRVDVVADLEISDQQLRLVDMDGTPADLLNATAQKFRVIHPMVSYAVMPGVTITPSGANAIISTVEGTDVLDRFYPDLVGRTVNISGSANPANDGSFPVVSYDGASQITIANAAAVSDTTGTAAAHVDNAWSPTAIAPVYMERMSTHLGFNRIEEVVPRVYMHARLIDLTP